MKKKREIVEKIYLKLVGLDFNQLSFENHIIISEIIEQIKKLRNLEEEENLDIPPPLPTEKTKELNILEFPLKFRQTPLRLMVIDEDMDVQNLIAYSLKNESQIEIISEKSPLHALMLIPKLRPDIILIDIMMKSISCFEFFKELKKLDPDHKIEIIIGSYHPNRHEKEAAIEMGATDYIAKPYDLVDISFKLKLKIKSKERKAC